MDTLSPTERSKRMGLVKGKNTRPEIIVRKLIYSLGYRYRLHVKDMLGRPDIVFHGRRKVIFIHGCFWHRHENCRLARIPKSRVEFWTEKLGKNKLRDIAIQKQLIEKGWAVMTIWECEISNKAALVDRIKKFMDGTEIKNESR